MIEDTTSKKYSFQLIFIFVFASITQIIHGYYAIYNIPPPGIVFLVSYFGLFWLVGDWFMKDSKKHNVSWAFDMGFFLYLSWPIFIPFYLFKTRGLRNASLISIGFILLYFGSFILSYEFFTFVLS